jgi:hypothetical protein
MTALVGSLTDPRTVPNVDWARAAGRLAARKTTVQLHGDSCRIKTS